MHDGELSTAQHGIVRGPAKSRVGGSGSIDSNDYLRHITTVRSGIAPVMTRA